MSLTLALGLSLLLFLPAVALAGYPPGSYPGAAPTGAFPTVLVSQTVGASGGTLSATSGAAAVTVSVPAGAFAQDTQVTIYGVDSSVLGSLLPSGYVFVDGFAIGWTPTSTALHPLTLVVTDPNISATCKVFQTTASGLTPDNSASVRQGSIQLSFTTDPGFVVGGPSAAATPPPSATPSPVTTLPPTSTAGTGSTGGLSGNGIALLLVVVGLLGLTGLTAHAVQGPRRSN